MLIVPMDRRAYLRFFIYTRQALAHVQPLRDGESLLLANLPAWAVVGPPTISDSSAPNHTAPELSDAGSAETAAKESLFLVTPAVQVIGMIARS